MAKRNFVLTPEEARSIQQILETCTDDPSCLRMRAVLWYGTGRPSTEIIAQLGCSRTSLLSWCQAYRTSGVPGLLDRRLGGNNRRLTHQQLAGLTQRLKTTTPRQVFSRNAATPAGSEWTVHDLYRALRMWYGVVFRSSTSYYNLLQRVKPKSEK